MKAIFTLALLIIISTFAAIAQQPELPTITIPDGRFENFFISLAAVIPLVTFITALVNRFIRITAGWAKQTLSWIIAMAVALAGWYLKVGIFETLTIYGAILYGFGAGLAANGFFDIKIIQAILEALRLQPRKTA